MPVSWGNRRNKHNARPKIVDGIRFDSTKEANRYQELKLLEKADEISELKLHHPFSLEVNGRLICVYEADFVYFEHDRKNHSARLVIEDTKGYRTREYKIKKKLLKAIYGYDIVET